MTSEEFNDKILVFSPKIFRFAVRLTGNEEQARDVTQDVLERMWRKRSSLEHLRSIESFLMQTVKNCCYDIMRRTKVIRTKHDAIAKNSENATRPECSLERGEIKKMVTTAISQLPDKQREAIHLRDVEGYEFEEIAAIMNCNLPTVRVYLSRARKTVSEKIKKLI